LLCCASDNDSEHKLLCQVQCLMWCVLWELDSH